MLHDVKQKLVKDLQPLRAHENFRFISRVWISLSIVVMIAVLSLSYTSRNLGARLNSTMTCELTLLAVASLFASVFVLKSSVPGKKVSKLYSSIALVSVALWAALLLYLTLRAQAPEFYQVGMRISGMMCSTETTLLSGLFAGLFWAFLKRGAPSDSRKTGIYAVLAVFCLSAFWQRIACPMDNSLHIFLHHLLPVIPIAFLGRLIFARILKW